jgi:protein-tyrosine phosphatase
MASLSIVEVVDQTGKPASVGRARRLDATRALRRVYRGAVRLYDRALHQRRHFAVVRKLSNRRWPRRILVICHGNICRSPYLQVVLQLRLPNVLVASAGFVGAGRPAPQISIALCEQRGLDLSRHRSQPITKSLVAGADLVIVMDSAQARRVARTFRVRRERIVVAGDLQPMFEVSRSILDPWKESAEVFSATFDRLDRCAENLLRILQSKR